MPKPDEHTREHPKLGATDNALAAQLGQQPHVERIRLGQEEHGQEAENHQRRAEQREQEELDGRIAPVLAAPHTDHEVHRQQDNLEEHEEEDEVLGEECADHSRLEDQYESEERLGISRLGDVVEAIDDAQRHNRQREQHERKRYAVYADDIPAIDDIDPAIVDGELELTRAVEVELGKDVHAHRRCAKRCDESNGLQRRLIARWQCHQHDGTHSRDEDRQAQRPGVKSSGFHLVSLAPYMRITNKIARMAAEPNNSAPYCCTFPD